MDEERGKQMNKVIMIGRLTKEPEIRYAQGANGTTVGSFSIAVDRKFKREGEPDADFFNCTAFGKTAEFLQKYVKKGTKIVVEGRLQNDTYTNKEGNKVMATKILADQLEFAESKKESETTQDAPQAKAPESNGFMDIPSNISEELPFT